MSKFILGAALIASLLAGCANMSGTSRTARSAGDTGTMGASGGMVDNYGPQGGYGVGPN
ncbi:MAG TPA: hypothetical protein VLI46_11080 [Ramlibacter sp.]|nr:hypothetical protein [Ramlibacter sp.]